MRRISDKAKERVENEANAMLQSAIQKYGSIEKVPVSDPDYAEAYGILRGVVAYLGSSNISKDSHDWIDRLRERLR